MSWTEALSATSSPWLETKVTPSTNNQQLYYDVDLSIGLALAPWNVLGGGKLRTDEEEKRRLESGEKGRTFASPEWLRNETEVKVSRALEKVAKEVGAKQITAGKCCLCLKSLESSTS